MAYPRKLPFIAALALVPVFVGAEVAGLPLLPVSERIVYARTIGDKSEEVVVLTRLVSSKDGAWYELTMHSPDQDSLYRLDTRTLFANYAQTTIRSKESTIRRVTEVLEERSAAGADEILLPGIDSLPYSLRAFDWGSRQKAKIRFLGTVGGSDFRFGLDVAGKESIVTPKGEVVCWKVQISLDGVLGSFFGKSSLWYSVDFPHYLVKSEGSSAGPGSPQSVLTLVSYSAGS